MCDTTKTVSTDAALKVIRLDGSSINWTSLDELAKILGTEVSAALDQLNGYAKDVRGLRWTCLDGKGARSFGFGSNLIPAGGRKILIPWTLGRLCLA